MNRDGIMCRGCGESHETNEDKYVEEMRDSYGYSTGWWCHECYDSDRYPYRRDRYFDPSYAGERLEDDY
jgi:hypothetical protein